MVIVEQTLHDLFYPNPTRKVGFFVFGMLLNGPWRYGSASRNELADSHLYSRHKPLFY